MWTRRMRRRIRMPNGCHPLDGGRRSSTMAAIGPEDRALLRSNPSAETDAGTGAGASGESRRLPPLPLLAWPQSAKPWGSGGKAPRNPQTLTGVPYVKIEGAAEPRLRRPPPPPPGRRKRRVGIHGLRFARLPAGGAPPVATILGLSGTVPTPPKLSWTRGLLIASTVGVDFVPTIGKSPED
jgi:hypothetical protein